MLIDPPFITAPGVYELVLESFDKNGSVMSTLREDTITLTISSSNVETMTTE